MKNKELTYSFWFKVLALAGLMVLFFYVEGKAQDAKPKKYEFRGYVKDLRSIFFIDGLDGMILHNTVHNRLNFKWYPYKNITLAVEARNQLFYGGLLKEVNQFQPFFGYADLIEPPAPLIDASWNVFDERAALLQVQLDRFWIEWVKGDFQIRLGRQRINWGQNWVWNPNDLFNAYSYVDFDYEERPGADAVHLVYYTGYATQVEMAFAPARDMKESIAAVRYVFNKANYDFQFIAGYHQHHTALGFGWAGNIKNAGLKGEISYFRSIEAFDEGVGAFSAAVGSDYAFKWGMIIQAEFLYNSNGQTKDTNLGFLDGGQQNSRNLFPFKYAFFLGASYPINPVLNVFFGGIVNPADGTFYLSPALDWSLKENLDLLINAQLTEKTNIPLLGDFRGVLNTRLKWSF